MKRLYIIVQGNSFSTNMFFNFQLLQFLILIILPHKKTDITNPIYKRFYNENPKFWV